MRAAEIGQFLQHVGQSGGSVDDVVNAREALTLMYEQVLHRSLGEVALPAPPRLLDRLRLALRVRHYDAVHSLPSFAPSARDGRGRGDGLSDAPGGPRAGVRKHAWRRALHERDLARGLGRIALPFALARKYPRAALELGWQFLFASRQLSREAHTGEIGRHHVHEGVLARAVTEAARRVGEVRRVGCHALRHSFATHLVERGVDIRTVQ